jgi:hypothetical protein
MLIRFKAAGKRRLNFSAGGGESARPANCINSDNRLNSDKKGIGLWHSHFRVFISM